MTMGAFRIIVAIIIEIRYHWALWYHLKNELEYYYYKLHNSYLALLIKIYL